MIKDPRYVTLQDEIPFAYEVEITEAFMACTSFEGNLCDAQKLY